MQATVLPAAIDTDSLRPRSAPGRPQLAYGHIPRRTGMRTDTAMHKRVLRNGTQHSTTFLDAYSQIAAFRPQAGKINR